MNYTKEDFKKYLTAMLDKPASESTPQELHQAVGEMVMNHIRDVDEVAYVRFASVYRSFKDINTFMEELTKLLSDK